MFTLGTWDHLGKISSVFHANLTLRRIKKKASHDGNLAKTNGKSTVCSDTQLISSQIDDMLSRTRARSGARRQDMTDVLVMKTDKLGPHSLTTLVTHHT